MRPSPILALLLAAMAPACMHAKTPWAVSPTGHGGAPSRIGPGPRPIGWRAHALAAPEPQECHPRRERSDLRCVVCPPSDPFAQALPHTPKLDLDAP